MVKFSTTNGVSDALDNLVKTANKQLIFISPYLQISTNLRSLLKQADKRRPAVDIKVVCRRDSKWSPDDITFLQSLDNVRIKSIDGLHAKIYLNESTAIITSMNLYMHSQQNNKEVGLIFDSIQDKEMYDQILLEVNSLFDEAEKLQYKVTLEKEHPIPVKSETVKEKPLIQSPSKSEIKIGYCIRCGTKMGLDPNKPLCSKCYPIWAKYSNRSYNEKYCHICGKESYQTINDPVCKSCSQKLKK
jgi:phosphatidylserine/phosphatidylglycerophosphate/cardiolipin synthase-like enzyme